LVKQKNSKKTRGIPEKVVILIRDFFLWKVSHIRRRYKLTTLQKGGNVMMRRKGHEEKNWEERVIFEKTI